MGNFVEANVSVESNGGAALDLVINALDHDGFVTLRLSKRSEAVVLSKLLGEIMCETQVRIGSARTYLSKPDAIPPHTDHPDARFITWYCNKSDNSGAGAIRLVDAHAIIDSMPVALMHELSSLQIACPTLLGIEPAGTYPLYNMNARKVFYAPWLCDYFRSTKALLEFEKRVGEAEQLQIPLMDIGDTLIVDNSRMLHFRDAIHADSQRWLTRYWIG
ncbi:putative TauD domain-containing protein [Burkholderia multivorans]